MQKIKTKPQPVRALLLYGGGGRWPLGPGAPLPPPPRPDPDECPSTFVGVDHALHLRPLGSVAALWAALPWAWVWVVTLGRLGKPLLVRIDSGDPEEDPWEMS